MSKDANRASLVGALCAGVALLALAPASATAATITPNVTSDEDTANASCSLREAITAANTDGDHNGCNPGGANNDADTIVLQSGQTYSLSLNGNEDGNANGDLDVLPEPLTIQTSAAARATIDANGDGAGDPATTGDRVLHSFSSDLTLTNLTLTDGQGVDGGAIKNESSPGLLTITGSSITANKATSTAGAMRLDSGVVSITNSEISNNTAPGVGGIWNEQAFLTVTRSTIASNHAQDPVNGNVGGLLTSIFGSTSLINTTVSGNTTTRSGGGVFSQGTLTLANATVANNTADVDGGANGGDGGGLFISAGTTTLRNSIIADNTDASTTGTVDHEDCSGTITSQGYNLIEVTTGCTGTVVTDVTAMDPVLGALGANGGLTETHALLAGSPAINAGNPAAPGDPAPACEALDQRGQLRGGPAGTCDIGAYEKQPPVLAPISNRSVEAGQNLTFTISAADPDPADTLTFSASNLPAGATFTPATRTFSWTPSAAQAGSFPGVGFAVNDGTFNDNESITITVTAPPSPPPTGSVTTPVATPTTSPPTGQRAAALKKCKKKRTARARRNCRKRANKLPL